MSDQLIRGFFAYPSKPARVGDSIRSAVNLIERNNLAKIKTWEEMAIGGIVIIDLICEEIDKAPLFCADLNGLNPNVMFELGYAITKEKRIWPILDTSIIKTKNQIKKFETLTNIGIRDYINGEDIFAKYCEDLPHNTLEKSIYQTNLVQHLVSPENTSILYLKARYEDNASVQLSRFLNKSKLEVVSCDPKDAALREIAWYGTQIYKAAGVICHLSAPSREDTELVNSIYTLVAGMAHGFGKPLTILVDASEELFAPLDLRKLLRRYGIAQEAVDTVKEWIAPIEEERKQKRYIKATNKTNYKLATELKGLQFGEVQAEFEIDELDDYFIPTSAYWEAVSGKQVIFIGRKGTGKTANFHQISHELIKDKNNLVCKIQPDSYQLPSLVNLLKKFDEADDTKEYAIEALWKFLIYSQLAQTVAEQAQSRPSRILTEDELTIINNIQGPNGEIDDFSVRLEKCVNELTSAIGKSHLAVSEVLYSGVLKELRQCLKRVLNEKKHVAILIDDLDKAWDKQKKGLDDLMEFLLGLLTNADKIINDLKHDIYKNPNQKITLTIFLRSDIFHQVREIAPERDKLRYTLLKWNPQTDLPNIIEKRYIASHDNNVQGDEMWEKFFCEEVEDTPTLLYLTTHILPRPRDLILLVDRSVKRAIDRSHTKVEEVDVLEAKEEYSLHALNSIIVEAKGTIPQIEDILYAFVGLPARLTHEQVSNCITEVLPTGSTDQIIDLLLQLNFLGIEINEDTFHFPDDPQEIKRNYFLAKKLARKRNGQICYQIHCAFWSYLHIDDI